MHVFIRFRLWCILITGLAFYGCAGHETITLKETDKVYIAQATKDNSVTQFSPVFLVYDYPDEHNKIGQPAISESEEEVGTIEA